MMDALVAIVAEVGPRTATVWLAGSAAFNVVLLALLLYSRVVDIKEG